MLDLMAPDKIVWVSATLAEPCLGSGTPWNPAAAHLRIVHQAYAHDFIVKIYRTIYNVRDLFVRMDLERVRQVVPEHPLSVMGDTRFDSVIERREPLSRNGLRVGQGLYSQRGPGQDEEGIIQFYERL